MAAKRTALFIIDIQNDLASDPETRIPHAARLLDSAEKVLASTRKQLDTLRQTQNRSRPLLVFVQHSEDPSSGPLVKGTKPWELVFHPRPDDADEILVGKTTRDTFESNPDLADRLKENGVTSIVALGAQSECCVLSTCKGALAAGFEVTLLQGAHSTYDIGAKTAPEIEKEVEAELERAGAKIVPWEDVIVD
ncbi:Isochorismatase hydrolase [Coniochaeta ligniaria NRRL 30616]|uniref:Isochorismatase hydrolase n=1 Tax=Coniochaeta ligniaria NRRL 30616 TaxID=1408157 RepID=A0A1J7J0J5_9PEZI|nr:Isochorismatase hydrolase [Coniochaeta ligniaria NRRL 30616]